MTGNGWRIGIHAERPQGLSGLTSIIDANTFITNSVGAIGIACIRIEDFVDATDEMVVSNNTITINANMSIGFQVNTGMLFRLGNSDRYFVHDNHINFGNSCYQGVGIGLSSVGGQNLSFGHIMRHNDITGISTSSDVLTNPLGQCFSSFRVQGVDYCDNTVDQSIDGFLFLGPNDITLRNNHINNHRIGVEISGVGGRIGKQEGHGNEWALDPNACVQFAAAVYNSNPFLSEFIVPEGNALPWLPPNAKLDPDPTTTSWFHTGSVPLNHCVPMMSPEPRQLTPYEKGVVLGPSDLSGIALWDLKREVYAKLLIYTSLRPIGSPEAAFFNSLSSTAFSSFGNVVYQIKNALALNATYQQTLSTYSTAIELSFANLEAFDMNINYSSVTLLSEAWFDQRNTLLQQVIVNAAAETALQYARNQQLSTGLQNALTYNTAISTSQPYESAQKTIHELRIRHLLGQPITQSRYQQALALAQQGEGVVGKAANDAINYLASCDQNTYQELGEEGGQNQDRKKYISMYSTQLEIAPNPSTGLILVSLPQLDGSNIIVYNISGQKVKSLSIVPGISQISLDLGQNTTGLYWVVLSNEVGKVIGTAKLFITH